MKIYTFYMPIPNWPVAEDAVIEVWKGSWSVHGWTPIVLDLKDACVHPKFSSLWGVVTRFPTINDRLYERYCFVRWCAFALVAEDGIWFGDHDVMNYGFRPQRPDCPTTLRCPPDTTSIAFADRALLERFIDYFIAYTPGERDTWGKQAHVSDMTILAQHQADWPAQNPIEIAAGRPGWKEALLVHYHGASTPPGISRQDWMKNLRQ